MNNKQTLQHLALAVTLAVTSATAGAQNEPLSYTYVEGGYLATDIDDTSIDGDGLWVGGSLELSPAVFVLADYSDQEFDFGIDADQWRLGLGAHTPVNEQIDLVGTVSYVDANVDAGAVSADGNGYGLGLGLRGRLNEFVELEGGINHVDIDQGDDTSLVMGGRYFVTDGLAVGVKYVTSDDLSSWGVNLRYHFK